jgi:abnormal spindle-like microcephaly-associated protein
VAIKNFKHFSNIVRAVTLIQSNWRCASVTRAFQRSLRAAMILQSWARAQIAKKLLIHRRQELFKWEMERTNFAATEIQKVWRGYVQNVDFILLLLSAIKIQTQIRSSIKHKHFTSFKSGIVQLQALVRGHATKSLIAQKEKAAICIQAFIRGTIQKSQHRVIQSASILVQSALRGYLTRIRLELEDFAATEIQRIWRGYDVNVDFLCMSLAAIRIQAFARRVSAHQFFMARKSYRLVVATAEGHFVDRIAEKIQRTFRRFIYRRNLSRNIDTCQRIIRGFLAKSKIARLKRGILVLQSICRGNSVRITRSKKVRNVARRIARANKRAIDEPEMKLGVRTFRALQVLQKSKKLSEIMKAMLTLEVSTRLSKRCCGSFAHARAPDILYGVVRTCNRSLPHIELLNHLLLTLRNVARHDELLEYVASPTSLDVLLDLVQMFRDKDIIFVLAVTLLEQVAFSKYEYMVRRKEAETSSLCANVILFWCFLTHWLDMFIHHL